MHTQLIANELKDKGFPIYAIRTDSVVVKFKNRSVLSLELTRALLDLVEDGLIEISAIAGVGIVKVV